MRPIQLNENQKNELYKIEGLNTQKVTDVINALEFELDGLRATPDTLTQALRLLWLEHLANSNFKNFSECRNIQTSSPASEQKTPHQYNPFEINESLIRASRSLRESTEDCCTGCCTGCGSAQPNCCCVYNPVGLASCNSGSNSNSCSGAKDCDPRCLLGCCCIIVTLLGCFCSGGSLGMLCEQREPDAVKCCKLLLSLAAGAGMGAWLYLNYRHDIFEWGGHIQNSTHINPWAGLVAEWFTIGNATLMALGLMMCCCSQFQVCGSRPSDPSDPPLLEDPSINEFAAAIKTRISNASAEVQDLISQIKATSMKTMLTMPQYQEIIRHYISLLGSPNATDIDILDQCNGVSSGHRLYLPPSPTTMIRSNTGPTPSVIHDPRINSAPLYNVV